MKWYHLLLIISILISLQRCANQKAPGGGPKDTIPPSLVKTLPENNQKNYKGKIVTLDFDENVKIKDAKEVIITPTPGKIVKIIAKNRTVTIEPKDGWKDSTTYSIAFREAIQDITESNPARNLHLAFSTGPVIDSLSISGSIYQSLKETIPDRVTVALYQQDTFNIFKHSPVFFTETNKAGNFKLENLKPGIYHIYAFADKNKNLKADSQSEFYGFDPDTVNLKSNREHIEIALIKVDSRKLKVNSTRHNSRFSLIRLSKPVTGYSISNMEGRTALNTFGDNQGEIQVYHPDGMEDSVAYDLTAKDSLFQLLDTVIFIKASDAKYPKETFKATIGTTKIDTETGNLTVDLSFTHPLAKIKKDTLTIKMDSAYIIKIQPADILMDTARKKASFTCTIDKQILIELGTPATLFLSKGVFISVNGDSSKELKSKIPYLKEEETAKLSIEIKTSQPHFVIQLLDKDYKIVRESRDVKNINFVNLTPTDYKIRAIIDTNNNGTWDLGNYRENIAPEKIVYLRISPKTFDQPVRANWEVTAPVFSF